MELFILYLWLKLNVITGLFAALAVGSAIYLAAWLLHIDCCQYYSEKYAKAKALFAKKRPWAIAIFLVGLLFATLIPSKTDVAVLVGGHYALKLTNTPEASKVMSLLRKKANDLLDEELKEKTK